MTFPEAMVEAEIEEACQALNLEDSTMAYVVLSHRERIEQEGRDTLLDLMLDRGCDFVGYVQAKLEILKGA